MNEVKLNLHGGSVNTNSNPNFINLSMQSNSPISPQNKPSVGNQNALQSSAAGGGQSPYNNSNGGGGQSP